MKIIKQGQIPDPNYHGTCHNCRSEIEAEPKELNITHDPRERSDMGSAICPVCKKQMFFYPKKQS